MTSPEAVELNRLEPCPFCGKPLYVRNSVNPHARCKTEGCFGAKMPVVNLDVPSDVAAWNTRALRQASPMVVTDEERIGWAIFVADGHGADPDDWLYKDGPRIRCKKLAIAAIKAMRGEG
jgi:hypothetical protein